MLPSTDSDGPRRSRRIATILRRLVAGAEGKPIGIAQLQAALGERATPATILILGALNVIPTPPGTSAILGPLIIFFAAQLLLGPSQSWLPKWVLEKNIPAGLLRTLEPRLSKLLKKAERMMKPRLTLLLTPPAMKLTALMCMVLGAVITMPIPFGNVLPGLALSLFALGLIGRDGLLILAGTGVAIGGVAVTAAPVYAGVLGMRYLLS